MATDSPGSRRVARGEVALLGLGSYATMVGVVFFLPLILNARAQQNDVFLSNLFLGVIYSLIGSTVFIVSLAGLGMQRWRVAALALGNPAVIALAFWLTLDSGPVAVATILLADAGVLIAAAAVQAGMRKQLPAWGKGLLVAVAGAGVVSLVYDLFGSRYYAFGETVSSLPPYLDLPVLGFSVALGIVVYAIARVWSKG